ncbi:hypothetical protein J2X73_003236 [Novosphingobium sp. 1748]|uniref:hypothetical protein n=1 Tax=Novosphingobium sp. 1748 TaxID=2817760 RepID=UPI0028588974|nr:hypothetical protein [Novosphingobium sp. 1748]MDR6708849.1 hypothetical protein [Novosphingobium sp. 1748]
MPKYPLLPPYAVLSGAIGKADALAARLQRGIEKLKPSAPLKKRLNALLGFTRHMNHLTLADVQARKVALQTLFAVVEEHVAALVPDGANVYHVTLVDDIGLTTDRKPIIRWTAFRRKVDKAIRALGLSGIAFLEIQPLTNYPAGGKGRTLMLNAHVLAWGGFTRRKLREAKRKLNQSRSWRNSFGAEPVNIRRLKRGVDEMLLIACYISKLPFGAKYRVPHPRKPGQYRFKPTLKGFTDTLALRLIEGLSQISLFDAVFCIGEAKSLRKIWKSRLVEWQRQRSEVGKRPLPDFDVAALWEEIREANDDVLYKPFVIR